MATTRLLTRDFQRILRLKYEADLSNRAIARACSVGVGTVSNFAGREKPAGQGLGFHGSRVSRRFRVNLTVPLSELLKKIACVGG